jgi:hypothetical protein
MLKSGHTRTYGRSIGCAGIVRSIARTLAKFGEKEKPRSVEPTHPTPDEMFKDTRGGWEKKLEKGTLRL